MSTLASIFQDIANAIRSKTNNSSLVTPINMANSVNNIPVWRSEYLAYTESEEDMPTDIGYMSIEPSFNKPVTIGSKVTNCKGMFSNSQSIFNQPITIPNSVIECSYMFSENPSFNQPIVIPGSVKNCFAMFMRTSNLNQPVTISNDVNNFNGHAMLMAQNFNQPVVFPTGVTDATQVFGGAMNMCSDIVFLHTQGPLNTSYLLWNTNNSLRKNVYCRNLSLLNATNRQSIVGANITWSATTNGYYNSTYNIYILNNIPAQYLS